MTKSLALLAFLPLSLTACGSAPEPAPVDPAKLDRFYAALETESAVDPLHEKLAPADRLSGAIEKLPAEKIDPNLVARVIAN